MSDIDTMFRPGTYFRPQELTEYLLSRVKGAELRRDIKRLMDAGQIDHAIALIGEGGNWPEISRALEAFHPQNMGGNYLPDIEPGEVEIGRICLYSTTGDVTALYARHTKGQIQYRVVDEYDGDTLSGNSALESREPLTLGELVDFLLAAWDLYEVLESNFEGDLEESLAFFRAESGFYPDFDALLRACVIDRFGQEG